MSDVLRVEAIMFALGKRTGVEEVATLLNMHPAKVTSLLKELQTKYTSDDSALELVHQDGLWKFTVKEQYLDLVKGIVTKTELDRPTLETLAVIAFEYPVLQSVIIQTRGSGAYEHIKTLSELGYVVKEKSGRSFKLKLTPKFFDYFDLPKDKLKDAFKDIKEMAEKIEEQVEEKEGDAPPEM
tara:strand:+ start:698 stop:1246 length:549 start_codon:yes stop_codon:yes gene_type:complete